MNIQLDLMLDPSLSFFLSDYHDQIYLSFDSDVYECIRGLVIFVLRFFFLFFKMTMITERFLS